MQGRGMGEAKEVWPKRLGRDQESEKQWPKDNESHIEEIIKRRYPHKLVTTLNMKEFPSNEMSYILGRGERISGQSHVL